MAEYALLTVSMVACACQKNHLSLGTVGLLDPLDSTHEPMSSTNAILVNQAQTWLRSSCNSKQTAG